MFPAHLYKIIYIVAVSLLTIIVNFFYLGETSRSIIRKKTASHVVVFFVALAFSIFIGQRPISGQYFVDMGSYADNYSLASGEEFTFNPSTTNFIFDNLFLYLASAGVSVSSFFMLMALMYFLCAFFACRKLFPEDTFIAFVFFLAAFSTFSYSVNGMKAGVAASWFLLAIAYRRPIILCVLFALISLGFHHSMQLLVVSLLIVLLIRNTNFYIAIWLICLIISVFHISFFQNLFATLTDEQGAGYLIFEMDSHWASVIRFRLDFVLYSSVPIVVGFYMTNIRRIVTPDYRFILNLYLLTNSVWLLCMYAAFTNRIAYLSWFMYPIVLIYPFLKDRWSVNQYFFLSGLVYAHLVFTIIMLFIY